MKIDSSEQFICMAKKMLVRWYKKNVPTFNIESDDVKLVWVCKTLQNCKCVLAVPGKNSIYAEYTFNGDKSEVYEDIYCKIQNRRYSDSDGVQ